MVCRGMEPSGWQEPPGLMAFHGPSSARLVGEKPLVAGKPDSVAEIESKRWLEDCPGIRLLCKIVGSREDVDSCPPEDSRPTAR